MLARAEELLKQTEAGERAVRLLGLTVSHLTSDVPVDDDQQLPLPFPEKQAEFTKEKI